MRHLLILAFCTALGVGELKAISFYNYTNKLWKVDVFNEKGISLGSFNIPSDTGNYEESVPAKADECLTYNVSGPAAWATGICHSTEQGTIKIKSYTFMHGLKLSCSPSC